LVVVNATNAGGVSFSRPIFGVIGTLALLAGPAVEARPSVNGENAFQAACERMVGNQAISIVAIEPHSGKLRTLVHPQLAAEAHPPGSVFKLVTGLAAIEAGVAPPKREFTCLGRYRPPRWNKTPLPCWKPGGHGHLELEEAIALSCNVTFYQLTELVGFSQLAKVTQRTGLAAAPGWLRAPGDPYTLARLGIGEGQGIAITAEQLAGLVGAIACDGPIIRPSWSPEMPTGPALAAPPTLKRLRTGMRDAVVHGSARHAACKGLAVAGKTGTATYTDGTNRTYGWFTGFAPAERPAIAIVVFEREGTGFGGAAKLGRRVFEAWQAAGRP
jgi:peptidoglycan glycosyltransferase